MNSAHSAAPADAPPRLLRSALVLGVLVSLLFGYVGWSDHQRAVEAEAQELARTVFEANDAVRAALHAGGREASDLAAMLAADLEVQALLREAAQELAAAHLGEGESPRVEELRSQLQRRIEPLWQSARLQFELLSLQFHLPEQGFLRFEVQRPRARNEPPQAFQPGAAPPSRPLLRQVLQERQAAYGFEIESAQAAMRGVAPVFDTTPGVYAVLGLVEVARDLSRVLRPVDLQHGADFALLLDLATLEQQGGSVQSPPRPPPPFELTERGLKALRSLCPCDLAAVSMPQVASWLTGAAGRLAALAPDDALALQLEQRWYAVGRVDLYEFQGFAEQAGGEQATNEPGASPPPATAVGRVLSFTDRSRVTSALLQERRVRAASLAGLWGLVLIGVGGILWGIHARYAKVLAETTEARDAAQLFSRALFDVAPSAIMITDLELRILKVNPSFELLTGYEAEDALGRTPGLLQSGEVAPEVYENMWQALNAGRAWRGRLLNRRKSGRLYWDAPHIAPLRDDAGEVVGYVSFHRDITGERQEQEALNDAHARLDFLLSASPTVIYSLPLGDTLRAGYVSDNLRDLCGVEAQMVLTDPRWWLRAIHPDDRMDALQSTNWRAWPGGKLVRRYRFRHADGHYLWVADHVRLIRDAAGEPVEMVGSLSDISREVSDRDRLQKIAAELPGVLFQLCRTQDGFMHFPYVSQRVFHYFEVTEEQARESAAPVLARIHPEDRRKMELRILESARRGSAWSSTFRVQLEYEPEIWLESRATPEKLEDGSVIWNGFAWDVTERRVLERAHAANERLHRVVFEHVGEAIFLVAVEIDGGFRFVGQNPQHQRATGIQAASLLGRTPHQALPGAIADTLVANYQRCVDAGHSIVYEEHLALPIGERTWRTQLSPVRGEDGRIELIVGLSVDVSDAGRPV